MSIEVVKDCADIWARLFDHRPFLNSEIKLCLKEFEESRKDREYTRLSQILSNIENLHENRIPKVTEKLEKLKQLNTLLEVSLQNSNTILDRVSKHNIDEVLKPNREMRASDWEEFMNGIESEYSKIDTTFKSKEEELKEFYKELERNLHLED